MQIPLCDTSLPSCCLLYSLSLSLLPLFLPHTGISISLSFLLDVRTPWLSSLLSTALQSTPSMALFTGRGGLRGRGNGGAAVGVASGGSHRWQFSQITTPTKLQNLFDRDYLTERTVAPRCRSSSLRRMLKGDMTEIEWVKVCDAYSSFFSTAKHTDPIVNLRVRGPLTRVFNLLRLVVLDKYNRRKDFFTNGCGKLLSYELLTLHPTRDYHVIISTTAHPHHDWCGIYSDKISGVVDVMVRTWTENDTVVLGEVKGASDNVEEGIWQLVAAMQTVNNFSQKWPIGEFCSSFL